MEKLKKSHGKAEQDSWQSSRRLVAKFKKTRGKAQEDSWQSSRRLVAKLKKTHGKAQKDSWQSSKFTTTQVEDNQIIKVNGPITRTFTRVAKRITAKKIMNAKMFFYQHNKCKDNKP